MPHDVRTARHRDPMRRSVARGVVAVALAVTVGITATPAGAVTDLAGPTTTVAPSADPAPATGGAVAPPASPEPAGTVAPPASPEHADPVAPPSTPEPAGTPTATPTPPGTALEEPSAASERGRPATPGEISAPATTRPPASGAGEPTDGPGQVPGTPSTALGVAVEAPTGLAITDTRPGGGTISWAAPTGGATPTGYRVELADAHVPTLEWSVAAELAADTRTTTVTGLRTSRMYLVRVVTLAGALESEPSQEEWLDVPVTRPAIVTLETVEVTGRSIRLSGWAVDPDTGEPANLRWSVDGEPPVALASDGLRDDVAAAYPGTGAAHGFAVVVPVGSGPHDLCVHASNPGELLLGLVETVVCRVVESGGSGVGELEELRVDRLDLTVSGWALDPLGGAAHVRYTVDGGTSPALLTTDVDRTDVAARYPGTGTKHGFSTTTRVAVGVHEVCAWVRVGWRNAAPSAEAPIGCRQVTVTEPVRRLPLINVESVVATPFGARVTGWALDPDVTGPITLRVTGPHALDAQLRADLPRPDVARAYPRTGGLHGFTAFYPMRPGTHQVCVSASDDLVGGPSSEQCRRVTIVDERLTGNFESLTTSGSTVTVTGWAVDPNRVSMGSLQYTVNGVETGDVPLDQPRPDVARLYPALSGPHGFRHSFTVGPGTRVICVSGSEWASDGGINTVWLGCRGIDGASPPKDHPMIANIESVAVTGNQVTYTGWALDPDYAGPVRLDVQVDRGFGGGLSTGIPRPDVARAYPGTGNLQGFSQKFTAGPGTHELCVLGPGDQRLSCRTFTVAPNRLPLANFEALTASGSTVTLTGWALDPDHVGAIDVHFYVNGGWGGSVSTIGIRSDVARAYPGTGDQHGFTRSFTAGPGTHQICTYAIDTTTRANTPMGCRTVTVR
ncbi:fibronectin type III domain-containing protein [Cellulomonas cellasea]|uniref:Fibronectin type-III domain-containing protein n=1 Tax=Cellulomonas cellasea TaxID=43670 RepID=A0A4Y3L1E3_9CELL|nr:fibronectin type III domain-containing protein [Cellulomonas cellasea]GEA89977.1 hypothetical protein CCE01nite_39260 [Cellulomonas cellasea]